MGAAALTVLALDQLTKLVVLNFLRYANEWIVIDGFFKFVHWGNTGAAWSMFHDRNPQLIVVSLAALVLLFFFRHHYDTGTPLGNVAMGMVFGGVLGNLLDRFIRGHVVDFIYFYLYRRTGQEIGFPAFNIADSGICVGVGILCFLLWDRDRHTPKEPDSKSDVPPSAP